MNIAIFDLPFPSNEDFFEPYDAELLMILMKKLMLKGYSVISFSSHNSNLTLLETIKKVELFKADLVIIYTFFYRQQFLVQHYKYLDIIISTLKKKKPNIKVIGIGNPLEVISDELQIKKMGFDYICRGDFFESLSGLIEKIELGKEVPLIINKNDLNNNRTVQPQIYWDENDCLRVSASKGCDCKCSFCVDKVLYGNWYAYDCENVINCIKNAIVNRKPHMIKFSDMNFIGQKRKEISELYVKRFCDTYLSNFNPDIPIKIATRIDNISDNILSMLRGIGVSIIFYGVESGCQRVLDFFSKGITPKKSIEILFKTKEKGITPQIGFIFFEPFIIKDEIIENINFLESISNFTFLSLQVIQSLRVFKGTEYAERFGSYPNFKNNGFTLSYDFVDDYSKSYYKRWLILFERLKNIDMYIRTQLDELLIAIEKKRDIQYKKAYNKIMQTYNFIVIEVLRQLLHSNTVEEIVYKYYDKTDDVLIMIKALFALLAI